MPNYHYRAVDQDGNNRQGTYSAENETALEQRLRELDLWLIEAKELKKAQRASRVRVSRRELVDFFAGLATLQEAGISASDSLLALAEETESDGFKTVIDDIRLNVESGNSLQQAMAMHPEVFSSEMVNLIRAGEVSGQIIEVCGDISRHIEWVDQLIGDVKQASTYPALVGLAVLGLVVLMFAFVVPKFTVVFDGLGLDLPALTKGVITVGELMRDFWWLGIALAFGLFLLLRFGPRTWQSFGLWLDNFKLSLPIFGSLNQMIVVSRFSHNLALMLKSGVPIVESLGIVRELVGNRVMQRAVADAELAVTEGRRMTEAFSGHAVMSPIVMRMMLVGEETGRLDSSLQQVSKRLDQEIPRRIKRLFSLLEPLIIVTLLGIVGTVAAAIFLPLFSIMSGLRG